VLAESAFHLESSFYVLSLLQDEMLRIAFDRNRNVEQLTELAEGYQERKPDLADHCLIRMSELYPLHTVITVEENDFHVYRRNKREAIPLALLSSVRLIRSTRPVLKSEPNHIKFPLRVSALRSGTPWYGGPTSYSTSASR
jgi:hypothetical protein